MLRACSIPLVWHVCRQTFLKGHILIKFSCTVLLQNLSSLCCLTEKDKANIEFCAFEHLSLVVSVNNNNEYKQSLGKVIIYSMPPRENMHVT
jgi:hypothetical protein